MTPGTRNDGLRLQLSGADVSLMRVVGAIAGVVVLAAAARNGVGAGLLTASTDGLSWQAPGSSTPGPAVAIPSDGDYLLEDGVDPSQWLRVTAYAAYVPTSADARIYLKDAYNAFGPDDVAAADALTGITETVIFTLKNVSPSPATNVKMWLDAGTADITVSSDGVSFYAPTSSADVNVLTWASVAAGASVSVWVKRIIGAAAASDAAVLNLMQWQWQSLT